MGSAVGVVLDRTSFYAEQGGQVADTGALRGPTGSTVDIDSCIVAAGFVLHVGQLRQGALAVGDIVTARCVYFVVVTSTRKNKHSVDYVRRSKIVPNHTCTHVLNFALRRVLGDHVDQKGSIVLPERLRFDFSNNGAVSPETLGEVEAICRAQIDDALQVYTAEVPLQQAKGIQGLRAVFGEVYPDPVRVVSIGKDIDALLADPTAADNSSYSIEFCGGTHLNNTKEAGAFALIGEEAVAKGVRRVVAVTGDEAREAIAAGQALLERIAHAGTLSGPALDAEVQSLKTDVDVAVVPAAVKGQARSALTTLVKRQLEDAKARSQAVKQQALADVRAAAASAEAEGRRYVVLRTVDGADPKALSEVWTAVRGGVDALLVASVDGGRVAVFGGCAPKGGLDAMTWTRSVLEMVGGKGGGKGGTCMGTGTTVERLGDALHMAEKVAREALG